MKDIQEAGNGQEGLTRLREADYGLVIADWNMPEMRALNCYKRFEKTQRLKNFPS